MKKTTQTAIDRLVKNWDVARAKFDRARVENENTYRSGYDLENTPIGNLHWDNKDIVWVYATDNTEDWEGNQTQLGVTKDGKFIWEYFSHCSCYGYEDAVDGKAEQGEFTGNVQEDTKSSWQLDEIPTDWEDIVVKNIRKILSNNNPAKAEKGGSNA